MSPTWVPAEDVARHLSYRICIPLMREAMIALSQGRTRQLLRGIIDLGGGEAFGVMPGAMLPDGPFGAKLVSVFPANFAKGKPSHQGVVALFDRGSGAPLCFVDASELTAIRTAAASAAATDILARPDAARLAILGYGEQGWRHVEAIREVRPIERLSVWGRSPDRAQAFAERARAEGLDAVASPDPASCAEGADIVCTTTAAPQPVLTSAMVADGTHINAVGSSRAGPAEIANDLVARARFFADHREGVRAQGAEFLNAKRDGLIGDDHILGEIGEVMSGAVAGRIAASDVTLYKSLGSIVQDLAAARHVHEQVCKEGGLTSAG